MVSASKHPYHLTMMYPGGCCYMLLLHVYTLADFLGFVDVLFQIIAFEYIVFYGGPFHFMCV